LSNDKKKTETSKNQLKMLKAPKTEVSKLEKPTEMLKLETPAEMKKLETPAEMKKLETPAEMKKLEKPIQLPKLEITMVARSLTKTETGLGDVVMTDLEIAVAPMHRLCKKAGADRVSEAAAKALAKAIEEIGINIVKEALDYAMQAGRKTIKAEDIKTATRKITGNLFFDYY
jgi:DNA-binding protein